MIQPITITEAVICFLLALGLTVVITGSKIGKPIRAVFCFVTWRIHPRLSYLWNLVQCPHCNAFWTGALTGFLVCGPSFKILQSAVISCGLVKLLQAFLGEDTLAKYEDYMAIFEGEE